MPKILLVEDEQRMAQTLEKGLQKAEFEVVIASDGMQARLMNLTDFDLVLLDWMLPGMSGLDLIRYWRGQKIQIPILMLTAREQTQDKVLGLDFGADDYMSKFFEWEELIARINALLRRVSQYQQVVGEIVLDRMQKQFFENGSPVHLTTTEYAILQYFFDNPKRVISRNNLIKAVYDHAYDPFSNVIDRHIKAIRQKFQYDPITTVRGFGYRLRLAPALSKSQN